MRESAVLEDPVASLQVPPNIQIKHRKLELKRDGSYQG
jgi:hypothetical protein